MKCFVLCLIAFILSACGDSTESFNAAERINIMRMKAKTVEILNDQLGVTENDLNESSGYAVFNLSYSRESLSTVRSGHGVFLNNIKNSQTYMFANALNANDFERIQSLQLTLVFHEPSAVAHFIRFRRLPQNSKLYSVFVVTEGGAFSVNYAPEINFFFSQNLNKKSGR